MFSRK